MTETAGMSALGREPEPTLEEVAVAMLVAGAKVSDVAEAVGRDERTIRRWRKRPAYRLAVTERIEEIRGRLGALTEKSLATFEQRVLDNPEAGTGALISAMRETLRAYVQTSELAESAEFGDRLGAIERRLGLAPVDEEQAA